MADAGGLLPPVIGDAMPPKETHELYRARKTALKMLKKRCVASRRGCGGPVGSHAAARAQLSPSAFVRPNA